ncbi:MAG TPA: CPBP family glutamic-type intramembrane protease [Candidatus Dormibacteraeota bacterium]|nr:CPBP family glutamic-type intramembrane protease [Candidatus Dormibacteraeota bacterium]
MSVDDRQTQVGAVTADAQSRPPFGGYANAHAPAPLWRRGAAAAFNGGIVAVGELVAVSVVSGQASTAQIDKGSPGALVVAAIMQAILVGGVLGYFGTGWYRGGTPGMRALGLTMVDRETGDLPRVEQLLLRLAGAFWSLALLPLSLIDTVFARDRRSWADRFSGTVVLHSRIEPRWWSWNGAEWVPTGASGATTTAVPAPTGRRRPPDPLGRSRWTWTDVVPIVVLQFPVALLGDLAVVKATRAAGLGRPDPGVGSLLLDVVAYGMIAALIWVFLGLRRKVSLRDLGMAAVRWRWIAAAIPALIVGYAAEIIAGELGIAVLPASPANQCHDIQSAYGTSLALALIGTAVVAPLVEEVLFRGVVFGWMRGRMPVPAAVVGSAAVFSLAHILYLQWTLLPPLFAVGCVLAVVYHYSRSLWPGIVIHASINTVATVALLLGTVHC